MVLEVLTAHCHVRIDPDQGDVSGTKKRATKKSLAVTEPTVLAPTAAEATAESTAEPTGSPATPAEDMSTDTGGGTAAAAADTWADALGVFEGLGDD